MSADNTGSGQVADLIYGLEDRPPFGPSLLAAFQHLLAALVGIVAPALIIGHALGLSAYLPYLVSMSLIVSGVGTYIQSRRFGPVGSGLLTVQGTSFSFVPVIIAAGMSVRDEGGSPDDMLALIFGLTLAGSLVPIVLSRFIERLRRIITPTTTGVVITIIGLSLIEISIGDIAGSGSGDNAVELAGLATGLLVVALIVALSFVRNTGIRMAAILLAMAVGWLFAWVLGVADAPEPPSDSSIVLPVPLRFGLDFDIAFFLPIVLIYLVTTAEAIGDLTANSVIVGEPIRGETYLRRMRGGVLGDGVNSAIAAVFGAFPNTTFSQNNGVIQVTGIASRHIAVYLSALLVLAGLIPWFGNLLTLIPRPVLGGATLILFGSIAVAGIRIMASEPFTRKRIYVIALSLGLGLGVALVPEVLEPLPERIAHIFSSAIVTSGVVAILLTLLIPEGANDRDEA